MAQKRSANRKKTSTRPQPTNGFESLLNTHTEALEENSLMIATMLQELVNKSKDKPLSQAQQKVLKSIKRSLSDINKDLDSLGE